MYFSSSKDDPNRDEIYDLARECGFTNFSKKVTVPSTAEDITKTVGEWLILYRYLFISFAERCEEEDIATIAQDIGLDKSVAVAVAKKLVEKYGSV